MATFDLGDEEALVLFDLLAREIDRHNEARLAGIIEHPAEFWALNSVYTALETLVSQPFAANYGSLLDDARRKITERYDRDRTYGPIGGGR